MRRLLRESSTSQLQWRWRFRIADFVGQHSTYSVRITARPDRDPTCPTDATFLEGYPWGYEGRSNFKNSSIAPIIPTISASNSTPAASAILTYSLRVTYGSCDSVLGLIWGPMIGIV